MTGLVFAALVSVGAAFLLSAAEAALWRMSRVRAQELLEERRPGAVALNRIVGDSAAYLSVTAFLRIVAESTTAVLITLGAINLVDGFWRRLLVAIGMMALVSFVVVGVSPRTLGRQHSDSVALLASPLIVGLRTFLGPVARVLIALGNAVTPGRGYRDGPFQSESELRDLVDLAGESSVIEAGEREMIHSVFELGDTVAREVMVPRTDMVTIDGEKSLRSAMSLFLRSGFSRIPVVGDGSDDILGLLYFKDVVRRVNADHEAGTLPVTAQMRPMHYVPESKPVDDLLREMQRDQSHFAVVVDEYGGTAGLVTIEDIIEEIVGEIADEHDIEMQGVKQEADGSVVVEGSVPIRDLNRALDWHLPDEEATTIAGLVIHETQTIPEEKQAFTFHDMRFIVMKRDKNRITRLRIKPLADTAAPAPAN